MYSYTQWRYSSGEDRESLESEDKKITKDEEANMQKVQVIRDEEGNVIKVCM